MEKHQALLWVGQPVEFVIMRISSSIKDLWHRFWEKWCQIFLIQERVFHLEAKVSLKTIFHGHGVLYLALRRPVYHRTQTICTIWLMSETYASYGRENMFSIIPTPKCWLRWHMSDVEVASIEKQYRPLTDAEIVSRKFSISLIFFPPPFFKIENLGLIF